MKIRTLERYAAVVFLVQAILVFLALIGVGARVAVYGSLDGGAGFYLFVVRFFLGSKVLYNCLGSLLGRYRSPFLYRFLYALMPALS